MQITESRGPGLKASRERERGLDHLRIDAHPEATPKKPCWVVAHFANEHDQIADKKFEFDDDHVPEMISHILEHIGASEPS